MDKITIEQLKKDKFLNALREEVELVANSGIGAVDDREYWYKGKEVLRVLNKHSEFRNSDSDKYLEYLDLADQMQMQTFYQDDTEDILKYLEENLVALFKNGIDVISNIRLALFSQIYAIQDRNKFVKRIKEIMEESREEFGTDYVEVGEMKAQVRPYLKNWILDYKGFVGGDLHLDMEISNYLFKGTNCQRLSAEDRAVMKDILVFYERTKRDPADPDSLVLYDLAHYGIESYGGSGFKARFKIQEDEVYLTDTEIDKSIPDEEADKKIAEETKEVGLANEPDVAKVVQKPVDLRDRIANMSSGMTPNPTAQVPTEIAFTMENIDSIRKLSLDVMRKVSVDPSIAINKIKSEIIRLTSQNPQDMPKAKELWQQSNLYKLYIEMSKQGMDANMPIDKVIESRTGAGKEVLSEVEFKAVVELSKTF